MPYNIQESWRKNAYEISEKKSINVNFDHLCEFIEREATIANNTMFGRNLFNKKEEKYIPKNKVKCNAIEAKSYKCWYCNGDHFLENCTKLSNETCEKRIEFLKKKELCFKCLSYNHKVKNCLRKRSFKYVVKTIIH